MVYCTRRSTHSHRHSWRRRVSAPPSPTTSITADDDEETLWLVVRDGVPLLTEDDMALPDTLKRGEVVEAHRCDAQHARLTVPEAARFATPPTVAPRRTNASSSL